MAASYLTASGFTGSFDTSGTTISASIAGGSDANRCLAVAVRWNQSQGHTIDQVQYNAVSATIQSTGPLGQRLATLVNSASGTNTLAVNPSNGIAAADAIVSALFAQGVDQITPTDGYGYNSGSDAGAPYHSFQTIVSATDDLVVVAHGNTYAGTNWSSSLGFTDRSVITNGAYDQAIGDGAGETLSYTTGVWNGILIWTTVGINFNAAAGAGAAVISPFHRLNYAARMLA